LFADTTNQSNPVAAATSNNTNQSVQFNNNGAPSRQYFGSGYSCNGPTMTFSPFYMGNDTSPTQEDSYVISENWGLQINFMVPLSRKSLEQCLSLAKRQEDKIRLDMELIRSLKCTEIYSKGFMHRPGSRVAHLCNDIIPISSYLKEKNVSNPKTNRFNLFKKR
tara:strand:+ start:927 stop:1418 length:492 start_codon:yes stop_codon:yes gene_type:complete